MIWLLYAITSFLTILYSLYSGESDSESSTEDGCSAAEALPKHDSSSIHAGYRKQTKDGMHPRTRNKYTSLVMSELVVHFKLPPIAGL